MTVDQINRYEEYDPYIAQWVSKFECARGDTFREKYDEMETIINFVHMITPIYALLGVCYAILATCLVIYLIRLKYFKPNRLQAFQWLVMFALVATNTLCSGFLISFGLWQYRKCMLVLRILVDL